MPKHTTRLLTVLLAAVCLTLTACGGGGGQTSDAGGPALPAKILSWSPPSSYSDNTTLNPGADLDSFEIYVKQTGSFTENDYPLALVSAINPVSRQLNTTFNLANLGPFLSPGVQYQVSVRAVALTGAKSDFSSPASFSF